MLKHSLRPLPIALALLLIFGIAAGWLLQTGAAFQDNGALFPLPAGQNFTNTGRQLVAISPDGTTMVYVANTQLFLNRVGETQSTPIAGTQVPQGIVNPVFSPDGQSVAFWSAADQMVKRISVAGGTPTSLFSSVNPFGLSWSADGRILAGQGAAGILSGSEKGGAAETVVKTQMNEAASTPQLLPGGDALLFSLVAAPRSWDAGSIVVQSLKSGQRKVLVEAARDPRYLKSGHLVYSRGTDVLVVKFDAQRLEVSGPPVTVLRNVRNAGNGSSHFSFSDNGALFYIEVPPAITPPPLQLTMIDLAGAVKNIGTLPSNTFAPRVSPDGKQLTFNVTGVDEAVYIYDIASANMRKLVDRGRGPVWTPDGTHIVYIAGEEVESLYWQRVDGSEREQLVPVARAPESWYAPEQLLSFITLKVGAATAELDYDIWTYSFRDKKAAPLIEVPRSAQHSSRFSPDGRWIAYVSSETGTYDVFVQPYPPTGAKYQITQGGALHPVWSPDGRQLYFDIGVTLYSSQIQTTPAFQAGPPVALPIKDFIAGAVNTRRQYDIMPDGKQFVMMLRPPAQALQQALQQAGLPQLGIRMLPKWGETVRSAVK